MKKTFEERHEARSTRRADRVGNRAERVEGRAANIQQKLADVKKPEGQRAQRLGNRLERVQGRAEDLRSRENVLRPNTPAHQNNAADPYVPPAPAPPPDPYAPTNTNYDPVSGLQNATPGTEQTISPYFVGGGQMGNQYAQWNQQEMGQINGKTTDRFADMFSKYVDVANREAGRQSDQISSALGSRGALYSSANLNQQADMRRNTTMDIAKYGGELQSELEKQRALEWQNIMGNQAGLATAEMGAREAAMGRAYQDFARRSDVPPLFQQGSQWAATRPGAGHTVQY